MWGLWGLGWGDRELKPAGTGNGGRQRRRVLGLGSSDGSWGTAMPTTGPGARLRRRVPGKGSRPSRRRATGNGSQPQRRRVLEGLEGLSVLLRLCPPHLLHPGQHLPQAAEWNLWPVRLHPFQVLCSRRPHVGLNCSSSRAVTRGFPPKAPRISHAPQGSVG